MYQIVMAEPAWDRFWQYVDLVPGEVAAFGYCQPENEGFVYVDELFLVPQEASAAQVDFMTEGLPYALKKATEDDRLNELRFCIHSHGTIAANWSGTDEEMIRKIGSTGTPWFASAIFNKDGKRAARVDMFGPSLPLPGMRQATVEADILCDSQVGLREECLSELEKFVQKPKPKTISKPSGNRPAGTQTKPKPPGPLNVADLVEYDDGLVVDMSSGESFMTRDDGTLVLLTEEQERAYWESLWAHAWGDELD